MQNTFSSHSKKALLTCDIRLQEILHQAIKEYDFSVLCGFRNEQDQNYAFDNGFSRLKFPRSRHNSSPSLAVDIAPYPIIWNDPVRFIQLSQIIKRIASGLFVELQWGGDWSKFIDMPHYEIVGANLVGT
jgi:peptidoglycan L-alanyl-D-glutamate endopeptidase CwlK